MAGRRRNYGSNYRSPPVGTRGLRRGAPPGFVTKPVRTLVDLGSVVSYILPFPVCREVPTKCRSSPFLLLTGPSPLAVQHVHLFRLSLLRDPVRVHVQGRAPPRVAQLPGHVEQIRSGLQQQCRVGMTEVMKVSFSNFVPAA